MDVGRVFLFPLQHREKYELTSGYDTTEVFEGLLIYKDNTTYKDLLLPRVLPAGPATCQEYGKRRMGVQVVVREASGPNCSHPGGRMVRTTQEC